MDIRDRAKLNKAFHFVVSDFNNRPHVSLNGLTPNEAEQNLSLDTEQLSLYKKNAAEARKKQLSIFNSSTSLFS
jgi:hypothetical protein